MRSLCIKQISSLGVVLPYDYKISSPPKIIPIVFFPNEHGNDLKTIFLTHEFNIDSFSSVPDKCSDLVFIRRNYDGSELYYYVNALTYDEIDKMSKFVKESKGGILL